jgi:hypothetical protein
MKKRPTDLKALFLPKVLSNGDTLYPLAVFKSVGNFFKSFFGSGLSGLWLKPSGIVSDGFITPPAACA